MRCNRTEVVSRYTACDVQLDPRLPALPGMWPMAISPRPTFLFGCNGGPREPRLGLAGGTLPALEKLRVRCGVEGRDAAEYEMSKLRRPYEMIFLLLMRTIPPAGLFSRYLGFPICGCISSPTIAVIDSFASVDSVSRRILTTCCRIISHGYIR
jgi:hypothetical protein